VRKPHRGERVAAHPEDVEGQEDGAEHQHLQQRGAVGGDELRQQAREEDADLRVCEVADHALAEAAAAIDRAWAGGCGVRASARVP
jgi:hypothetical protein